MKDLGNEDSRNQYRLRLCHQKLGRLRFLSHLELVGAMERAIRRARLPVVLRGRYNPHLRLSFGPPLPVGVSGQREYVDLYLKEKIGQETVMRGLNELLPPELTVTDAAYVPAAGPSLVELLNLALYRIEVKASEQASQSRTWPANEEAVSQLVSGLSLAEVERKSGKKRVDISVAVNHCRTLAVSPHQIDLELALRLGTGSIRPQEFVQLAFAELGAPSRINRLGLYVKLDAEMLDPLVYTGVKGRMDE